MNKVHSDKIHIVVMEKNGVGVEHALIYILITHQLLYANDEEFTFS